MKKFSKLRIFYFINLMNIVFMIFVVTLIDINGVYTFASIKFFTLICIFWKKPKNEFKFCVLDSKIYF